MGNETSDEDFSCLSFDFMTMEEFMDAYKTNWEFDKKEQDIKVLKTSSVHIPDSESEDDQCNTESVREDLYFDTSSISAEEIEELEQDADSEEVTPSFAENPHPQQHSPGCIHFMKNSDIAGIVAFLPQSETKFLGKNFHPEIIEFESDNSEKYDEIMTEEIDEDEKTNISELHDLNDTDEEDISDFKEDEITFDKDINLNIAEITKWKKAGSKKLFSDVFENRNTSEVELLGNFAISPTREDASYPQTKLHSEVSSVLASQGIKVKAKKQRNLNLHSSQKVEIEEF